MNKQIVERITEACFKHDTNHYTEVDILKFKLGLEIVLINISKMSTIYGLAILFDIVLEVFIFHFAFMAIRTSAFGAHAVSSFQCTIVSVILFIGLPLLIFQYPLNLWALLIIHFSTYLLLWWYAPRSTTKNYLGSKETQKKLKLRAMISNFVVFIVMIVIPNDLWSNLLIFGAFSAGCMVIPEINILFEKKGRRD